ncbi:MAG: hypothetical protein Q9200_002230 [Gallowayella weberi]
MLELPRWLSIAVFAASSIEAWPLARLAERQDLTLDVCANQEAIPDSRCWNLANIPSYLNDPTTGWMKTTPTCDDSTRCCSTQDDGWSTCYLRLALPGVGQDCTTLNDHPCVAQTVLAPELDHSIIPQVRTMVLSIYGVHDFFSTYYTSLNDAYAQALSVITDVTLLLDPNKATSISLFAILSALTVGLAFLTAPTMAASMLESGISQVGKYQAQSLAISLQQAPGVARSMWPAGDDLSRTYQIGAFQEQVSNISVELGNTLSRGLKIIMTDAPTFVAFADNGRYVDNPPLDPNEIKNDLAITLQTYLVSESLKQNNWWALPLKISTKEEYDSLHDPPGGCTIHGCSSPSISPSISVDQIYWSPASGRQYRLQHNGNFEGTGKVLDQIRDARWADLPLLFDGAYNYTFLAQVQNPQPVHVNYDGTLDIGWVSKLPMKIPCGTPCPHAADDGSCPFPFDADCSPPKGGGSTAPHGRPFIYPVRRSPFVLKCDNFLSEPFQNGTKLDHLFQRLIASYNDPRFRYFPVFENGMRAWEWYEPQQWSGEAFAGFGLEVPARDSLALKRGDFLTALWGVNEIRLAWPKLDFYCSVFKGGLQGKLEYYLARIELFYEQEDGPGVVETA